MARHPGINRFLTPRPVALSGRTGTGPDPLEAGDQLGDRGAAMSEDKSDQPQATVKTGGKIKLILLIALPLLLLAGGGGTAMLLGIVPIGRQAAIADIVFVELPDLLVNLSGTGPRMRFLKLAAALEVHGEADAEVVRQLVPRILDGFHLYLRAMRPEELQGAQGLYRVKEELLARTNEATRPAQVWDVLIRELLVQ
jgi:flagellar protein FliL